MAFRGVPWLVVLSGCGAAAPVIEVPLEPAAAFSEAGTAAATPRWWQAFGEPALDALVAEALVANPGIQAARHRFSQAAAVARRAGAELGPTLEATLGMGYRVPAGRDANLAFPLGISARYELDVFGRVDALEAAAAFDAQGVAASAEAARLAVAGQVASTFYQHGERLGQLRLVAAQAELNRQVLALVELRFQHGKAAAQDVLRQRQAVEAAVGEAARLQAEADVLRHRLAILAGRPPSAAPVAEPTGTLPPIPATGVPLALLQRRPDVELARLRVAAADRRVAAALADRWPRLSLQASASSGDVREIMDDWVLNLGANLVAPLLDGGRRAAEVDRTRAAVHEAVALYAEAALAALAEVEDALARGRHQQAVVDSLVRQLELAQAAADQVRARYGVGGATYVEVLDAVRTLQSLERTLLSARQAQFQHRIDLHRALAGPLPADEKPEGNHGNE